MSGSFYYSLKARFYGIFFQLPWSFFVTACTLMPMVYAAEQHSRQLLIELIIYWTLFTALLWLAKDLYAQRFLLEFSIQDQHLCVYKKNRLIKIYTLDRIKKVKDISAKSTFFKAALSDGVVVTFDDGSEIAVLKRISNYKKLRKIITANAMIA